MGTIAIDLLYLQCFNLIKRLSASAPVSHTGVLVKLLHKVVSLKYIGGESRCNLTLLTSFVFAMAACGRLNNWGEVQTIVKLSEN